jgi:hypothetical protein
MGRWRHRPFFGLGAGMSNRITRFAIGVLVLAWTTGAAIAQGQSGTVAGRFTVEHPTLENLGFEWAITGDTNRDASVAVEFRRSGEPGWRKALPLVRIGGERIFRDVEHLSYIVPDGFAGSIMGLQPGTEYEARFTLTDPDGTSGQVSQNVRVRTRTEPQPYAGGRTLHVYPPGYKGQKKQPAFDSLLQAYYGAGLATGAWCGSAAPSPATPSLCMPASTATNA